TPTATTAIYTLSLHDALPISPAHRRYPVAGPRPLAELGGHGGDLGQDAPEGTEQLAAAHVLEAQAGEQVAHHHEALPLGEGERRSEEHTSELQSLAYLVCRLL